MTTSERAAPAPQGLPDDLPAQAIDPKGTPPKITTRLLHVATAPRADSARWKQHEPMTWDELLTELNLEHPAGERESGGYVPALLRNGRRRREDVVWRSVLTLDADAAGPSLLDDVARVLPGVAVAAHTTWSHGVKGERWRLLAPLSRDLDADAYHRLARAVRDALGDHWGGDNGCPQPERFMYRPATQGEYRQHVQPGGLLDVDGWLADEPEPEQRAERAELHPYAARAVESELARLDGCSLLGWDSPKGWNDTTYEVACQLIEFANSPWSGYSLDDAHDDLLKRAPTDPGFGPAEHEGRWRSAMQKVGTKSRPRPDGDPADDFAEPLAGAESEQPGGVLSRFPRMSVAALLDPNRPEREWVVEPLIAAGTSTALVAPAGHRKSLLALRLALAVARGEDEFAGMTIPRARRVCYVDMENTEDDLRERLTSFGVEPGDELERFVLLSLPQMDPLDTAKGGREFVEALSAYGLGPGDLVVLDSFQRVTEADEDKSDTTRAFYRHTGVRLKALGLTVLRTDNTGKDASRGARGSSGKRDDVDVEYLLKSDGDYVEITVGKARQRGVSRMAIEVVDEGGRTTFRSDQPTPSARRAAECVERLDELGVPSDAGEGAARKALGDDTPRAVLRDALKLRKQRSEEFSGG